MSFGGSIDKAISHLFPSWAKTRARDRIEYEQLASFHAAERRRDQRERRDQIVSADQAIVPDMAILNARARAAVINDWAASSIVGYYRRSIVGTGITSIATAADKKGKLIQSFNDEADELFDSWAKNPGLCDIEKRKSLVEIQGLMASEFATVGQSMLVIGVEERGNVSGLRLQVIEPEMLDTRRTKNPESGNEIRNGIEVDLYGAPVAYWLHPSSHPLEDFRSESVSIPAVRVLHFMRQNRPRQSHGYTVLAPCLDKLSGLSQYDSYTMIRAKYEAAIGASVRTEVDAIGGGSLPSLTAPVRTESGKIELRIEPGMVLDPGPGRSIEFHSPQTPGSMYDPFTIRQIKEASAGCGLDYPVVARDYTYGNFSSQRQAKLEREQETDALQLLLIDAVLRPIRIQFTTLEVLSGRLKAPGFFNDPKTRDRYLRHEWQPQPKPWVDPANEAAAVKLKLEQRLTTHAEELNTQGKNYRRVFQQQKDVESYAEQIGLELVGVNGPQSPFEANPGKSPNMDPTIDE